MKSDLKQLFAKQRTILKKELTALQKKLLALELIEKQLFENHVLPQLAMQRRASRTRDAKSLDKTAAFLMGRARAITASQVAREFKISTSAAQQRLSKLVAAKRARRVGRGKYAAWSSPK
jgi:predicted HTH transcriptional regulator